MNIKIIIVFSLSLYSCGKFPELPYFDNPQLEGLKDEGQMPRKIFGTYESLLDSGLLTISKREVILRNVWNINAPLTDVDSASSHFERHYIPRFWHHYNYQSKK